MVHQCLNGQTIWPTILCHYHPDVSASCGPELTIHTTAPTRHVRRPPGFHHCQSICVEWCTRPRLESERHWSCFLAFLRRRPVLHVTSTLSTLWSFWWCAIEIFWLTVTVTLRYVDTYWHTLARIIMLELVLIWENLFITFISCFRFSEEFRSIQRIAVEISRSATWRFWQM